MHVYLGLDIGGTKIIVAAANSEGKIFNEKREKTPINLKEGIHLLNEMIVEVSNGCKIKGIGAAIGGPLDYRTGVVSPLNQPEWRNVPLKKIITDKWNCPFYVDVDTNIAALGEYHFSGKSAGKLFYMTISTGVGGGFIVDGEIYRGANGAHPEVGHISIKYKSKDKIPVNCLCGASGCLQELISGNGIFRRYKKSAGELDESEWDEVAYNLGQGLRNIAALYCPDVIVLGGGVVIGRGEKLIQKAKSIMESELKIVPVPEVEISKLGYRTSLMGAIFVAINGFVKS